MKHFALTLLLALLLLGCSRSRPEPADNRELLVDAATRPIAGPPAGTPPEPARPYYPRADFAPGYIVDPQWPIQRGNLSWGPMAGAAIDGYGNIWTLNRGAMPVQVFTPEGRLLQAWPNTHVKAGHQIRIDREGFVWIADYRLHVVRKFDRSGQLLLTLGIPNQSGVDEERFNLPCDVAVGPGGDVFIADGYGNNRIVHRDAKGAFIKAWGKMGVGEGEFSLPHSIVMDSKGLLYVADRNNNRIQVFDQSGKFVGAWSGQMVPWTIWITDDDELYVVGSSPTRWGPQDMMAGIPPKDQIMMRLTTDFRVLSWWSFPLQRKSGEEKPGELNWVHAVAVDGEGNLFLGDVQGNRIQKFWLQHPTTVRALRATRP